MYTITELTAATAPKRQDKTKYVFFALYYTVADNAFQYAARTWLDAVKTQRSFKAGTDVEVMTAFKTEKDFKQGWEQVDKTCKTAAATVAAGAVFSHASKQEGGGDGLEFIPEGSDGTLIKTEIAVLPKLSWADGAYLLLASCNSGLSGQRGWSLSNQFAKRQGVVTLGQTGYAYFSKKWASYEEKGTSDTKIALWAYARGKNSPLGGGGRMLAQVSKP
ncbi:hypothetical protein [Roseospira goensis]|uniref:DUF4347 domain-containing protein n=1 Tax=Roseospira goensis TaxID=391922 RepID=A0A7W6RZE0_9PROT|nr:hypothetical protein [Roseospira goensis]MBB4286055.1 hypothetical protein [Roseospira goensis]